jgi:hypothetical protein
VTRAPTRAPRTARGRRRTRGTTGGSFASATDCKGGKAATGETPDHFKKMLEKPCPNHAFHIKHLYKVCALLKKYLSGGSKRGE